MKKNDVLDQLFCNWQAQCGSSDFARDGIVNEELWEESTKRILFVLKEPKDPIDDLRVSCDEAPWPMLGYWAYGLQYTTANSIVPFSKASSESNWKKACRSSALANVKKSSGGYPADINRIKEIAARDSEFIRKEVEIIEPDLVVCGGLDLFEIFKEIMPFRYFEEIGPDGGCYKYDKSLWIRCCHPSYITYNDMKYYTLMVLYQNCLREMSAET